ncbi:hypothetical protein U1Q18_045988, partial [Sarracenia purpurea var. burkii]
VDRACVGNGSIPRQPIRKTSSPATGDGRASSGVGTNGTTGSEAVVCVVRSAAARRARYSIRRQSSVGDVVAPRNPVQGPPIDRGAGVQVFLVVADDDAELVLNGDRGWRWPVEIEGFDDEVEGGVVDLSVNR